jgi:chromosomal replication initiator protein
VTAAQTGIVALELRDALSERLALTPGLLITAVAYAMGIRAHEILGRRRFGRIVIARHLTAWLMRELLEQSSTRVGHELGGLDHATVLHAWAKVDAAVAGVLS